jgi:hypothetical protein
MTHVGEKDRDLRDMLKAGSASLERAAQIEERSLTLCPKAACDDPAIIAVAGLIAFQRGYWDNLSFLKMYGLPIE